MPEIVVCICTHNRPHLLAHTLGILRDVQLGTRAPADVALVVVDNGPDGRARAVCDRLRPTLPVALHFVEEPCPGLSFARNRAAAEALALGALHMAFIDDDDEPRPDWLCHLLEAQARSGADIVFGGWVLPCDLRLSPWLRKLRYFEPMKVEERNSYGLPGWAGTYNVLLTRRLLLAMGRDEPLFRPEFAAVGGEDTDLFIRAHRAGISYAVAPDSIIVRVWEAERLTLRGMLRRAFKIGHTRIMLAQRHDPPEKVRKMSKRALCDGLRALGGLPGRARHAGSLGQALTQIAFSAGQVYAARGGRYAYYRLT